MDILGVDLVFSKRERDLGIYRNIVGVVVFFLFISCMIYSK